MKLNSDLKFYIGAIAVICVLFVIAMLGELFIPAKYWSEPHPAKTKAYSGSHVPVFLPIRR